MTDSGEDLATRTLRELLAAAEALRLRIEEIDARDVLESWDRESLRRLSERHLGLHRLVVEVLSGLQGLPSPPAPADRRSYARRLVGSIRWKLQRRNERRRRIRTAPSVDVRVGPPRVVTRVEVVWSVDEPGSENVARGVLRTDGAVPVARGTDTVLALAASSEGELGSLVLPAGCLHRHEPGLHFATDRSPDSAILAKLLRPRALGAASETAFHGATEARGRVDGPFLLPNARRSRAIHTLHPALRRAPAPEADGPVLVVLEDPLDDDTSLVLETIARACGREDRELAVASVFGPTEPRPDLWREHGRHREVLPLGSVLEPEVVLEALRWRAAVAPTVLLLGDGRSTALRGFLAETGAARESRRVHVPWSTSATTPEDWRRLELFAPGGGIAPVPAPPSLEEADLTGTTPASSALVWIGDLLPDRRPEDFVRLASRLRDVSDLELRLVGEGPLAREIDALIAYLGLEGSCLRLPSAELPRALVGARLVVSTSTSDRFPARLLGAVRSTPVLAVADSATGRLLAALGGPDTTPAGDVAGLEARAREILAGDRSSTPPDLEALGSADRAEDALRAALGLASGSRPR